MSEKAKLLFLSAGLARPGAPLRAAHEFRAIDEQIRQGLNRERFEVVSSFAVRRSDLQQVLIRERPQIVHFGGHGEFDSGIELEDDFGQPAPVSGESLAALFGVLHGTIRVVVLNACESNLTARALQSVVEYAIGMRGEISDEAAIVFATAFYRGLAHNRRVPEAFALGVNQLQLDGIGETDIPQLFPPPLPAPAELPATREEPPARDPGGVSNYASHVGGDVITVTIQGNHNVARTNTAGRPRKPVGSR
jgi:CHAT domain